MGKQKICIIGGSLTGLATAISLSRLDCNIDLIASNFENNIRSSRTLAISENSLNYLNKLNIFNSTKQELWPCSIMKLYTQSKDKKFLELFEINNNSKSKKILYMLKNSKFKNQMISKIKKIKSINIKSNNKINEVYSSGHLKCIKYGGKEYKYNLVIVCTGSNSFLVNKLFGNQFINNSYKEKSITTILKHNSLENNIARQIFLNNEILALLPVSNTKTSIVWSVKNDLYKKNDKIIKEKIKFYVKDFIGKISFTEKIESKDLNFLICKNYYKDRILLFGDALHVVHPFAGQGFNMTIRDLESLEKILYKKLNLGLDIGTADILEEFSSKTKPRNFIYSMGIDLIKNTFSFKKFRNNVLKILNKSNIAKNMFYDIANQGFKF